MLAWAFAGALALALCPDRIQPGDGRRQSPTPRVEVRNGGRPPIENTQTVQRICEGLLAVSKGHTSLRAKAVHHTCRDTCPDREVIRIKGRQGHYLPLVSFLE